MNTNISIAQAASSRRTFVWLGRFVWALIWGGLGTVLPILTPAVALMQGYGQRIERGPGTMFGRRTSLDMAGCSITVTLLDDEMTKLWDAPVHTAALRWGV